MREIYVTHVYQRNLGADIAAPDEEEGEDAVEYI
jgi:hypothetical protein